mgnify:CR=1 FL=1
MELKKTELLGMSKEELEKEENKAWDYFKKVRDIKRFLDLEE